MSFKDEYDSHKKATGGSDFYQFKKGDNFLRIMSDPVKKVSRWGHGMCFEGAPYCDPQKMQEEYQAKLQEATKEALAKGLDPKKVKVSKPGLSTKWSVWAIDRSTNQFVIVDLPNGVADDLRKFMDGREYSFNEFPMPYDINIIADENVGTITVKYNVQASRKDTPVTEAEMEEFKKKQGINLVIDRMKAKAQREFENGGTDPQASNTPIEYPDEQINSEDIPF